jgi:molybdopterin adenylyltransferase
VQTAILTISTSVAAGRSEDTSGKLLAELAQEAGAEIMVQEIVSDDRAAIEAALRRYIEMGAAVVFTTGGTGLTPDDVTPEATRAVIERDAPGFAEAMRAESTRIKPLGMLSRGVAGTAKGTLIINFPGNPKAIRELFPVIAPTLQHAIATLRRGPGGRGGADGGHAGN